jgi:hypothetical protein
MRKLHNVELNIFTLHYCDCDQSRMMESIGEKDETPVRFWLKNLTEKQTYQIYGKMRV